MKTDLEVEVEVDLRQLGKVIIFRDKHTDRTFLLYIDISMMVVSLHNVGGSLVSDQFPLWRALLSGHPSLFFVFPFDVNNLSILYYFLFKSIYSFL